MRSHVFLTTSGCGVSDPATIHCGHYLDPTCIVVLMTCDHICINGLIADVKGVKSVQMSYMIVCATSPK